MVAEEARSKAGGGAAAGGGEDYIKTFLQVLLPAMQENDPKVSVADEAGTMSENVHHCDSYCVFSPLLSPLSLQIQEASCSALACLVEQGAAVTRYTPLILATAASVFPRYFHPMSRTIWSVALHAPRLRFTFSHTFFLLSPIFTNVVCLLTWVLVML